MNKLIKLVLAASAVVAISASAQTTDIKANSPYSAYLQDGRGVIARSGTGLCWHTGYWTPADAVAGCDGAAPAKQDVKKPVASSKKVTYAADAFFDFDKSVVKPAGKKSLDKLVKDIQGVNVEVIIATGHTDSIGSDAYNQKLSVRRAEAVKAYLVKKGVPAKQIYTEGKGEKQPVASNKTKAGRAKNRRVEIEVVGSPK
ncbi:MAG: OmpA family protein [Burkholderiaceae bacterium]|nr:OmpA family protein [Burkholderiaceae bacterium]